MLLEKVLKAKWDRRKVKKGREKKGKYQKREVEP
jgi:hypothetical protein